MQLSTHNQSTKDGRVFLMPLNVPKIFMISLTLEHVHQDLKKRCGINETPELKGNYLCITDYHRLPYESTS